MANGLSDIIINADNYKMVRVRDLLETTILKKKRERATQILQKYPSRSKIDKMYRCRMQASLYYYIDKNITDAIEYLKEAVHTTLPNFSYENIEDYLISEIEIYLVVYHLPDYKIIDKHYGTLFDWAADDYTNLYYIEPTPHFSEQVTPEAILDYQEQVIYETEGGISLSHLTISPNGSKIAFLGVDEETEDKTIHIISRKKEDGIMPLMIDT